MPDTAMQAGIKGRPPVSPDAPRGEQEVRAALVGSASRLFAAHGPANVSVRAVAVDAGVNHGLVHHYFGSKDGLLRAVLDDLAVRAAAEVAGWDGGDALFVDDGAAARHGRIVAFLLLDARDPSVVQTDFPAVHALVDRLRAHGLDDAAARSRAAQATALVLGWLRARPCRSRRAQRRSGRASCASRLRARRGSAAGDALG
jgi:AcrR family transcriptional regulator